MVFGEQYPLKFGLFLFLFDLVLHFYYTLGYFGWQGMLSDPLKLCDDQHEPFYFLSYSLFPWFLNNDFVSRVDLLVVIWLFR